MFDSAYLNLGSLFFGLIALALPLLSLLTKAKKTSLIFILSLGSCALSLNLQILNAYKLLLIEDCIALLDTWGAVTNVSFSLLGLTLLLNILVYFKKATH